MKTLALLSKTLDWAVYVLRAYWIVYALVWLATLAAGCALATEPRVCPWGVRDYLANYVETEGNCGAVRAENGQPLMNEPVGHDYDWSEGGKCVGPAPRSNPDTCRVTMQPSHCTEADGTKSVITFALDPQGSSYVGQVALEVTYPDGTGCSSKYMATYRRVE